MLAAEIGLDLQRFACRFFDMFKANSKRETIYDSINGPLAVQRFWFPADHYARKHPQLYDWNGELVSPRKVTAPETRYERSVRRQIARCVICRTPSVYFVGLAARHEAMALFRPGKGAHKREANRALLVAAALRDAGL